MLFHQARRQSVTKRTGVPLSAVPGPQCFIHELQSHTAGRLPLNLVTAKPAPLHAAKALGAGEKT
jgi:hypothetical protein